MYCFGVCVDHQIRPALAIRICRRDEEVMKLFLIHFTCDFLVYAINLFGRVDSEEDEVIRRCPTPLTNLEIGLCEIDSGTVVMSGFDEELVDV